VRRWNCWGLLTLRGRAPAQGVSCGLAGAHSSRITKTLIPYDQYFLCKRNKPKVTAARPRIRCLLSGSRGGSPGSVRLDPGRYYIGSSGSPGSVRFRLNLNPSRASAAVVRCTSTLPKGTLPCFPFSVT